MNFNEHSNLKESHALFSPSQNSWLKYSPDEIEDRIFNQYRAPLGTEIHEFSATMIKLGQKVGSIRELKKDIVKLIYTKYFNMDRTKESAIPYGMKLIQYLDYLPDEVYETVKVYINDAIGFKMTPEQVLYYSDEIYGTTDAISFRDNYLRIYDLKTGARPAHMEQLEIYAALFCLEYKMKPRDIGIELRLYQEADNILVFKPTVEDIAPVMDQIVTVGKIASKIKKQEVQ